VPADFEGGREISQGPGGQQKRLLILLGVVFAIALVLAFVFRSEDVGWREDREDKYMAIVMAEKAVKERLVAPATARFSGHIAERQADGRWIVCGYVDAQNRFGALIRNKFCVALRYRGQGSWEVLDVLIVP